MTVWNTIEAVSNGVSKWSRRQQGRLPPLLVARETLARRLRETPNCIAKGPFGHSETLAAQGRPVRGAPTLEPRPIIRVQLRTLFPALNRKEQCDQPTGANQAEGLTRNAGSVRHAAYGGL